MARNPDYWKEDAQNSQFYNTLAKQLLREEATDMLARLKPAGSEREYARAEINYAKAEKIAQHWLKNYLELDFRSPGSYTRAELERIATKPDAL